MTPLSCLSSALSSGRSGADAIDFLTKAGRQAVLQLHLGHLVVP